MVNVSENIKQLYKTKNVPKYYDIYFPELDTHVNSHKKNDKIVNGSFELTEGICFNGDLKFGKCNSAQVKITVADVESDIAGKEFRLTQTVDDAHLMPFGYFTVATCPKQDDLRFKDITAYDRMKRVEVDVAAWYNSLTFPMTLAAFRASFLANVGLVEDTSNLPLPNDSMIVEKTVTAAQMPGREVIEAIGEINGVFGVINPEGKFSHVILKPGYGDYPTNDYPQNDYPISEKDTSFVQPDLIDETVTVPMRESIRFEEFTVPEIDKLIIRGEEDDIGAIVGQGTNAYIIEGNFLVFGKSAAELETIATGAFGYMAKRPYRPYQSSQIGLPYVKPGDMLKFDQDEPVIGYMLNRTLKGVQGLRDEITASGTRERKQNTSQNTEIVKLKYKTTKLKVDIDGVLIEVEDLEAATAAQFAVMSNEIYARVEKDGVIAAINLTSEEARISASKINLEGYVTITSLNTPGSVTIDGGNLKAGTVTADVLNAATGVFTGTLYGVDGTFSGTLVAASGTFNGKVTSNSSSGRLEIDGATITGFSPSGGTVLWITASGTVNAGTITAQDIHCNRLNNATPITSSNIGSQSVYYASSSGSANSLSYTLYTNNIYASNTGYGNIDFLGFDNAAGVNWVQANFIPAGASDVRLKYDIHSLDDIPDKLFFDLKPKRFKYKTDVYGKGISFGLIAQQVENAFKSYGLNPYDYDLIEVKDVRRYTDDGFYVNEKTHRINYNNLIAWTIRIIQKQNERISTLEKKLYNT